MRELKKRHRTASEMDDTRQPLVIETTAFNNPANLEDRLAKVPEDARGALKSCLSYLYNDDGPVNLPRERLIVAIPYLSEAEKIVAKWLQTRTNGNLRKHYGAEALRTARSSRYRCARCGFADVRVLNLDHVEGRVEGTPFACLCANCHAIKSRELDWSGKSRYRLNASED